MKIPNQKRTMSYKEADLGSEEKNKRLEAAFTIGYFDYDEPVDNLTGNLQHWRQDSATYFVTFRTADSLPQKKLKSWLDEKEQWLATNPAPHDERLRFEFYQKFPQRLQKWLDNGYGKCLLADPACQKIVETALRHFDDQRYVLDEFVVATNHVHVVVTPTVENSLSKIVHSWKSFTANRINQKAGLNGAFWQKESFDHIVRRPQQLERIRQYIWDHNKVEAASSRLVEEASSFLRKENNKPQNEDSQSEEKNKRQDAASTIQDEGQDGASTL